MFNIVLILLLMRRLALPVLAFRRVGNSGPFPVCPRCGRTISREYQCYCDRCGQHLDWTLYGRF